MGTHADDVKTNPSDTQQTIPGANKALLGMCLAVMTFWLFALSMTPVANSISESLGLQEGEISLPLGFAGLVSGILIVPAGVLADRFGCLKMIRIGLIFSLIGSLLCGMANGQMMLIIGRMLQGVSAALIMPATLALLKQYFSEEDRPKAVSLWSMSSFGSAGVSSFFGGFVGKYFGWEWVFFLTIPIVIISYLLLLKAPESRLGNDRQVSFDKLGFILLVLVLMALNLAINRGAIWGWKSPAIIGCFAAFFLLLPLFISVEKKQASPIVDLALLKNKNYDGAVIANFLLNTGLGAMFIVQMYLQKGRGLDAFQASLMTLSYLVMIMTMIRVGEKLGKAMGPRKPMVLGTFLAAIGYGLMACTFLKGEIFNVPTYYLATTLGFAFMGIGNGFFATPATSIAVSEAPANKAGAATAIFKMASSLGGSLGIAICGALYGGVLNKDGMEAINSAAALAIGFCAVALLVACVVCLLTLPKPVQSVKTG